MRMLKWMAYGTIAFCAYQFFKGMGEVRRERSSGHGSDRGRGFPGRSPAERADADRVQIAAMPGEDGPAPRSGPAAGSGSDGAAMGAHGASGVEVRTTDPRGTSARHR